MLSMLHTVLQNLSGHESFKKKKSFCVTASDTLASHLHPATACPSLLFPLPFPLPWAFFSDRLVDSSMRASDLLLQIFLSAMAIWRRASILAHRLQQNAIRLRTASPKGCLRCALVGARAPRACFFFADLLTSPTSFSRGGSRLTVSSGDGGSGLCEPSLI